MPCIGPSGQARWRSLLIRAPMTCIHFQFFGRLAAFLSVLFAASLAQAATLDAHARYAVSLGGINVANMDIDLADDGTRYSLVLDATVSGLGSFVASGTAEITASGDSRGEQLSPAAFALLTRANGETFSVNVEYAGGNATAFQVEPPLINNIDRIPIERSHLRGAGDMLSAFVLKGEELGPTLCRRTVGIFTGVERFDIAMAFAREDVATSPRTGYQGPVILCSVRYRPVSGHFTTSEMTTYLAQSDRILIWYAPLGTSGYFIPYRVLLGTSMGDLSIVLTGLRF